MLTFDALRVANEQRNQDAWCANARSWSPQNWADQVSMEGTKLAAIISQMEGPATIKEVKDSMADLIIKVDLLAERMGLELSDLVVGRFNETSTDKDSEIRIRPNDVSFEELSSTQHAIWSHWMDYMFSCGEMQEDGSWVMPSEKVERWKRQAETDYSDLTPAEKVSDREQAHKVVSTLNGE